MDEFASGTIVVSPAGPAAGQCATTGGAVFPTLSSPTALTGQFVPAGLCPTSCGSSCRNGCLMCADGTAVGYYYTACTAALPAGTSGVTPGAIITQTGAPTAYNSVNEWGSCLSTAQLAQQCNSAAAWGTGMGGANLTGVFQPSASCPSTCTSACRYGCLYCADGSAAGFYPNSCNVAPPAGILGTPAGSLVTVFGTGTSYMGKVEFSACTAAQAQQCVNLASFTANGNTTTITGEYTPSYLCPSTCGSSCRNGCISCTNRSLAIGFYYASNNVALPNGVLGLAVGAVITVTGASLQVRRRCGQATPCGP